MRGLSKFIVLGALVAINASSGLSTRGTSHVIHGAGLSLASRIALPDQPNAGGQSQVFYVTGNVDSLYPGSLSALSLSIQNPLKSPITVNSLSLLAGNASSSCPSSLLQVVPQIGGTPWALNSTYTFSTSVQVPAGATVPGPTLNLTLAQAATDNCQGGSFPLFYGGTANG